MTPERFKMLVEGRLDHCLEVLTAKGHEYSRDGDRLHNFKTAARKRGVAPEEALLGMMVKHEVSIEDIARDAGRGVYASKDVLAEKIGDAINYLLLLEGLLVERVEALPQQKP